MATYPTELMLTIGAGSAADEQELADLSQRLRDDLIEIGADSAQAVRVPEAPAGAKGDPASLATLAVTLAPAALTGLITMLQSWLTRHERTSLTLEKGDEKITVTGTLSRDQQRVIADWLKTAARQ
ncbi:MAG: hypothetical protein ACE145_14600 [Terriglobia bacterium]